MATLNMGSIDLIAPETAAAPKHVRGGNIMHWYGGLGRAAMTATLLAIGFLFADAAFGAGRQGQARILRSAPGPGLLRLIDANIAAAKERPAAWGKNLRREPPRIAREAASAHVAKERPAVVGEKLRKEVISAAPEALLVERPAEWGKRLRRAASPTVPRQRLKAFVQEEQAEKRLAKAAPQQANTSAKQRPVGWGKHLLGMAFAIFTLMGFALQLKGILVGLRGALSGNGEKSK